MTVSLRAMLAASEELSKSLGEGGYAFLAFAQHEVTMAIKRRVDAEEKPAFRDDEPTAEVPVPEKSG